MVGTRKASQGRLEVRLLGPIEATREGRPATIGGPKPRMLLAILALDVGRVVSVDRLVEDLWSGRPPETAAHAIQVYVSQLRKALGASAIVTRAQGYVLELEASAVDLHRFAELVGLGRAYLQAEDPASASSSLREALGLWRGPALADFLYEPFAQTEIARLEELRVGALEDRVDADLALGRHVEVTPEVEALVQAQPLRERPRAQLMLALYRSGRQADALAAYRAARDTLVDELGIEPGAELRELEAAILRHDASLLLEDVPLARPAMQFRRLVTILFADVVESMAIADALDPEALGRVLQSYFETVSTAIVRHGGTVEKYAGDAVMAAFGVPVSHEDDALRAARAAVDIRGGIAALSERLLQQHGVGLEVRIGIESGEVVATPTDGRQRLVTGETVGIAAKLEQAAGAGEIVVGELAGRLIDHLAALEPVGEIAIKGKREPVRAYRLVEIVEAAPAFRHRRDARFVGRRRELAALRKALKRALESSAARALLVVGSPGVGKSRLAAELTSRARGVTALWGRCLAYGEGITYWPLREVLEHAPESDERAAVLAALEAETPPPAPEIAWLFRRFCEAASRERPLVLVFDDVHWAEPTFLDLVEHLTGLGHGPILVVCLARDEILEERPELFEGLANAEHLVLEPLSADETDALLDGLGGSTLESDQRVRIAETAEGNPLFLEQLLALALEGGLAERQLPETIQALLAARLDRLGPGERAVLERAAVVGKEFRQGDVVALLDPDAVPTAPAHLETLTGRGFVRQRGDAAFAFRHGLVQEAVYRAAPKRLRAELHERFADRLDDTYAQLPDLDELAGYHLEQAYRLRTELGESDRRTQRLAEEAGARLGQAGVRALKRGDGPASIALLERATSLVASGSALRGELLCELGLMLEAAGETDRARSAFEEAIGEARAAAEPRVGVRARMELEYFELPRAPGATGDALLEATAAAIPVLEAAADYRYLGRAWLLAGWVHGGRRGRHEERGRAAEQALAFYKRSSWPSSVCVGEIAAALYYGPAPVPDAIERCEALLRDEVTTHLGRANVEAYLGGLLAQSGALEPGRERIRSSRSAYDELGLRLPAATFSGVVLGDVELLAGDAEAAEAVLRWVCAELASTRALSRLASRAGDLAEALYRQSRFDDADEWVSVARQHSAADDVDARLLWMPVAAKLLARRHAHGDALALAHDALSLAERSDNLNRRGEVQLAVAEVSGLAGRTAEAASLLQSALGCFEAKGNVLGAARARSARGDPALV